MSNLPAQVTGALWMCASCTAFGVQSVIGRILADDGYNVMLLVFYRALVGLFIIAPFLVRNGLPGIRTTRLPLYGVRAILTYSGASIWFYALTLIPLVDATSLHFSIPLFGLVMAALILKEKVNRYRVIATLVGFLGVLVVLRPGFEGFNPWGAIALISALCYGGVNIAVKLLTATEPPNRIIFYMNAMLIALSLGPAIWFWRTPTWPEVPMLFVLAASTTVAQFCLNRAMASADASFLAPFDFFRLPFAAAIGLLLFAEIPTVWTLIGSVVIFGATTFMTRAEIRDNRSARRAARAG